MVFRKFCLGTILACSVSSAAFAGLEINPFPLVSQPSAKVSKEPHLPAPVLRTQSVKQPDTGSLVIPQPGSAYFDDPSEVVEPVEAAVAGIERQIESVDVTTAMPDVDAEAGARPVMMKNDAELKKLRSENAQLRDQLLNSSSDAAANMAGFEDKIQALKLENMRLQEAARAHALTEPERFEPAGDLVARLSDADRDMPFGFEAAEIGGAVDIITNKPELLEANVVGTLARDLKPKPLSPIGSVVSEKQAIISDAHHVLDGGKPDYEPLAELRPVDVDNLVQVDLGARTIEPYQPGQAHVARLSPEKTHMIVQVQPTVQKNMSEGNVRSWAARSGESIRAVLQSWSSQEGVELLWENKNEFAVLHDIQVNSDYQGAVKALLDQYLDGQVRPYAKLHLEPGSLKKTLVVSVEGL